MKTLTEQISRIKEMMNFNEDDTNTMAMLQQDAEVFNQEAEEDMTVEEYRELSCGAQSGEEPQMDTNAMDKIDQEGKSKLAKLMEAIRRASPEQLKAEKRKVKQLMAGGEMKEQAAFTTVIILGVPLGTALVVAVSAIIVSFMLYYIIKSFFNKNPNRRRSCTDPIY